MVAKKRITFSTRRFLVGKAGPFPRLVFREDVMLHLDQFSQVHTRGEHGGFLVGRKRELKTAEQFEVLVERFVPVTQKDDAARLVITQEHVETVERALREQEEEIVGWAHTHPGFGVFLSNFDKEQHLRFFPEPWHIAYVMDNQAFQRAAYHAADGEWHRLEGYYVLKEMAHNETVVEAVKRKPFRPRLIPVILLVALLIGAGSLGYRWIRRLAAPPPQEAETVDLSRSEPEPTVEFEMRTVQPETETAREEEPPAVTAAAAPGGFTVYIVREGDNLWDIADKLWGDPRLFPLLAEENNIDDPGYIHVGQVLQVPHRPGE